MDGVKNSEKAQGLLNCQSLLSPRFIGVKLLRKKRAGRSGSGDQV